MQDAAGEVELRDETGAIRSDFLHAVTSAIDEGDAAKVRELTLPLHEADLADLIQLLRPEPRGVLITMLGDDLKAAALPELDEGVRNQVLEDMPPEQVAKALQQLDSDEAVYLLEDLGGKGTRISFDRKLLSRKSGLCTIACILVLKSGVFVHAQYLFQQSR